MSDVLSVLQQRGFVAQTTGEAAVSELLGKPGVAFYTGYDPTADSLHVGNLVTLMGMAHLQRAGHRPIVLLGGGTARVGDPSGKTEMRQMLEAERIAQNLERIGTQVSRLLQKDAGATVVNNADWLLPLHYIDFLRDIGRHFSVNRMLAAEAYKARLERGLSFIEFNYQLLQAYDFLQLRRRYDCRLQLGGDDQWGNILAGVDLCRRVDGATVHGLTYPLLTTAAGQKMGKTQHGAVWLDADKVSPFDYYQFWVNTQDADVTRLLAIFTFLPMDQVQATATLSGAELNTAKSVLAFEATAIVHGCDAASQAHAAAQGAFGGRVIAPTILPASRVPRGEVGDAASMPSTVLSAQALHAGLALVDLLVQTGMAPSRNEARRLIGQGAVRLGDDRPTDPQHTVRADLFVAGPVVLRAGKKRAHRLVLGAG